MLINFVLTGSMCKLCNARVANAPFINSVRSANARRLRLESVTILYPMREAIVLGVIDYRGNILHYRFRKRGG